MSLHTGDGILSDDDYVGMDVHRAARVSSAAVGGQVLLSEPTVDSLSGAWPEGTGARDLGAHRLKDLGSVRLFQLEGPGLRSDFPPLASQEAATVELPPEMTTFVGRGDEVASILDELGEHRLITLTGPGGTGKSRLAIEAARPSREGSLGGS